MEEQSSEEEQQEVLAKSVLDSMSSGQDYLDTPNDDTLTETFTSDSEEGGDSSSKCHLRADSNISRASKLIKKEQHQKVRQKTGRKKIGGLCSVCSQHAFSRVNGVCKPCYKNIKGPRGAKRKYEDGAACSRCNQQVFGSCKMSKGMCLRCYGYLAMCKKLGKIPEELRPSTSTRSDSMSD